MTNLTATSCCNACEASPMAPGQENPGEPGYCAECLAELDPRATTTTEHRIRWWGVVAPGERVPRNRHMRGRDWGWDATCSCGWDSRTGGAIQARVQEAIEAHRREAAYEEASR